VKSSSDIVVERREALRDWALAVGLTLFGWAQLALVPLFLTGSGHPGRPPGRRIPPPFIQLPEAAPTWIAFALVALAAAPLVWRRRYPRTVLAATVLFAGVYDQLHQPPVLIVLAPLIALYTVGSLTERRTLVYATILAIAFSLVTTLPAQPSVRMFAEGVRVVAMFAFAAALGDATRNRRAYVAEVEQRALEAERTRDEEARRRVEEERLRIARELHDVTAHSLSIIAVQAGAAQRVVHHDAEAANRALETIRTTSKASLDELRAILGVLRGGDDGTPLAPAGSVTRIGEMASTVESAGVRVELHTVGLEDLPAYADLSAYRIVQEALTNVVRHAGAKHATVSLRSDGEVLSVEVSDDGSARPVEVAAEGHGIAGMRERVIALGGEFSAGPAPGGGFRVDAHIPLVGGGV